MVIRVLVLICLVLCITGCSSERSGYGSLETKHNAFFEIISLEDKIVLKHVGGEPIFLNETEVDVYKCDSNFESCEIFEEITFAEGKLVSRYGAVKSKSLQNTLQNEDEAQMDIQGLTIKEGDVVVLDPEQGISLKDMWLKVTVKNIPLSKLIASKEIKPNSW